MAIVFFQSFPSYQCATQNQVTNQLLMECAVFQYRRSVITVFFGILVIPCRLGAMKEAMK